MLFEQLNRYWELGRLLGVLASKALLADSTRLHIAVFRSDAVQRVLGAIMSFDLGQRAVFRHPRPVPRLLSSCNVAFLNEKIGTTAESRLEAQPEKVSRNDAPIW